MRWLRIFQVGLVRHDRRRVVLNLCDIRAICREETFLDRLFRQAHTAGTLAVALCVDPAKPGFEIEEFTGQFRVVDTPLKIYFFITASTTLAAGGFPIVMAGYLCFFHTDQITQSAESGQ